MNNRRNGCLLAVLALCALAIFLVWRARTPPTVTNEIDFAKLSPQQQQERRTEADAFIKQVDDVAGSARRKERKPFQIRATERVLNTLLQDRVRIEKFPIRDVKIGLAPHQLSLQGNIEYKGLKDVVATLTGDVVLQNNQLAFKAESLYVQGIPVNKYKDNIEREVSKRLNDLLQKTPAQLSRVEVEEDALVIEGITD